MEAKPGLSVRQTPFKEDSRNEAGERIPKPACPRDMGLVKIPGADNEVGLLCLESLVQPG